MTSRIASSTQSSPRRVIMPVLPLCFSRSATNTPQIRLPTPETDTVTKDLAEMTVSDGEKTVEASTTEDNPIAPTPNSTPIAIVVDESGSPTRQQVQLRGDSDVFESAFPANDAGATETNNDTAVNPVAQRILNNLRAPTSSVLAFRPRSDRIGKVANAANAQGIFPPDALIFVANLSTQKTEDELELRCHETFDIYGPNHIKIRRDKNKHPFAFVQFEEVDDANAAVSGAHGLILDGRKIRLERAKAERAVMLSKTDGSVVSEAETREILEPYGPLELIAATNIPNRRLDGQSHAMFVRFAYYLDCRDALRLFDNHRSGFKLFMAPSLEPRFRVNSNGSTVVRGFTQPRSAVDQKSVYVGNLPDGTSKAALEQYFSEFGHVLTVNVMTKIYEEEFVNNFAFVEFAHQHEAIRAAAGERYFQGTKLRVEAKEYSARHHARIVAPTESTAAYSGQNFNNAGPVAVASRPNHNNRRYNAFGRRQGYGYGYPTGTGVYNPQSDMTPPATIRYTRQNAPDNGYATPMQQVVAPGFGPITPPSQYGMQMSLNQMLPPGIFSPTPSHLSDAQYAYQGVPFGAGPAFNHAPAYPQAPLGYLPQSFPPIQEAGEEAQF